ncbi:MAG: DNA translocase FtsK [Bacteroidaceae bacterium]|nr:DNA translocase FtsK [Bacteroidaceae bacterium]
MHGIKVVNYLNRVIGVPGIIVSVFFTGILLLIYLSTKTVEVLREFLRFRYLQELREKRREHAEAKRAAEAAAAELAASAQASDSAPSEDSVNLSTLEQHNVENGEAVGNDELSIADALSAKNAEGMDSENTTPNEGEQAAKDSYTGEPIFVPLSNVENTQPEQENVNNDGEDDEKVDVDFTIGGVTDEMNNALSIANALSQKNEEGRAASHEEGDASEINDDSLGEENSNEVDSGKNVDDVQLDVTINDTELASGDIVRDIDPNAPYDPHKDLENYNYPTVDLLAKASSDSTPTIDMEEQTANKERIIHVLKNFGVEISSIQATIGPTITLYEIVPAEGTRISKIRNLEDDIALSLAAEGIRIIAPIPGKGTIGIEVPNKKKCIVSMESIINSKTYHESTMELPCAIGKTISNDVFMFDLAKAPHLLVAGATGQGKSVGLNAIVTSLLYKKHPSELKIVMVDPKKVEFSIYSPIENHFLARLEEEEDCIITDVQKVVKTLNSLCALMDSRYDLLKKAGVRNIKEYNAKFKARQLNPENGHEFMPYIVVIVDEFGDLIMTAGKEVELPICRIAQLARAVGIHMIIATQRPQASIISGAIKTNFPTRIAFKVSSMMDSRVILDRAGANQLIGKGDLLYLAGAEPVRVQCAFVDTPEVSNICHFIARQQAYLHPMYLPDVQTEDGGDMMGGDQRMDAKHLDPLFSEVAKFVVTSQQGSTSMIQRNYSIGYNRAGKIMDQLEKMGVVGPQMGSKPRQVLIQDVLTLEGLLNTLG